MSPYVIAFAILVGIWLVMLFLETRQEIKFERFRHAFDITPTDVPAREMLP